MKILRENKVLTEDAESAEERLLDELRSLAEYEQRNIWNTYCDEAGYYDDRIEDFDEDTINEFFSTPYEAMRAAFFGEVSFNHDFFRLNGYGNIVTGYVDDFADWDDVVKFILENDNDLGEDWIREILDEELNEDEEEDEEFSESYSESEIEKVLMKITDNFSDRDGSVETSYEDEKDLARDILKKHYKVVEVSDGRRSSSDSMSWVIAYSNPKR